MSGLDNQTLWQIMDARDKTLRNMGNQLLDKEKEVQELTQSLVVFRAALVEKENEIQKLSRILAIYRVIYDFPIIGNLLRLLNRTAIIFRPRLGRLNQYPPRPIHELEIKKPSALDNAPKISLVTPSFRQGAYLERTIRSVLLQDYPNLEYFVQDGGSEDETVAILKQYEASLSGWVSQKDGGQSQAINLGFSRTSGEVMGWLNSDDMLLPGAFAMVAEYFNQHPDVDVVYGNRLLVDVNDMEIGRWIMPGHNSQVLSWVDYIPQETMFWRRRIWEKVGGVDESFRFAMDWDLLVRFRDAGARFAHIPQFLGAFRIHENQKTSGEINDVGMREMERIRLRVLGRIPDRKEIAKAVSPFLFKHLMVDKWYGIQMRLRGKL